MPNVTININGTPYSGDIEPRLLLLHFIRDVANLTGTHWGCDTSNCGACVIQLDGQPTKSCTMLAVSADGHEVKTIEGMADGANLHPLQQAFIEEGAAQCGFCLNGVIMTAKALLERNPKASEAEIQRAMSGVLCSCFTNVRMLRAIQRAGRVLAERSAQPARGVVRNQERSAR